MVIVYLSPHLDDAALSCGGLIWEQAQEGHSVEVWTICAGDPPGEKLSPFAEELHQRWKLGYDATAHRREEDIHSCHILGAKYNHFDNPDAIYRVHPKTKEFLYGSNETIMGDLAMSEQTLYQNVSTQIVEHLHPDSHLISPLSLGNHVDHQLTRQAAEMLNVPLAFYADYPYISEYKSNIKTLLPEGYFPIKYTVSEAGLIAWQDSIAFHKSQISTFWENTDHMKKEINKYQNMVGGITLWKLRASREEKA